MKKTHTYYSIQNKRYKFYYRGKSFPGENKTLINQEDNLIQKTNFNSLGYKVINLKTKLPYNQIVNEIKNYIKQLIEKEKKYKIKNFNLNQYHNYVDSKIHIKIINKLIRGIKFSKKIPRDKFEKVVSDVLKIDVKTKNKKCPKVIPNIFHIRIVRPNIKNDFNPPHRDVYLDYLKSAVNIYLPICGSNKKSSLTIFPKSHMINEKNIIKTSKNSFFNNQKFTVPTIIKSYPSIKMIRPNPKSNQMLIFSPYLIHGGGLNENTNLTRVSLECRFWRY